jgi:hypothetical protein
MFAVWCVHSLYSCDIWLYGNHIKLMYLSVPHCLVPLLPYELWILSSESPCFHLSQLMSWASDVPLHTSCYTCHMYNWRVNWCKFWSSDRWKSYAPPSIQCEKQFDRWKLKLALNRDGRCVQVHDIHFGIVKWARQNNLMLTNSCRRTTSTWFRLACFFECF